MQAPNFQSATHFIKRADKFTSEKLYIIRTLHAPKIIAIILGTEPSAPMQAPNYKFFNRKFIYGSNLFMSLGKREASLTFCILRSRINSRSSPIPSPPWGGIPYL